MTESGLKIPRPHWIRVKGIRTDVQASMKEALTGCNTVCLSAKCPNLGECFSRKVAAFMIGGSICTRACRFCAVRHGVPEPLNSREPELVAESAERLGLRYVVVTSVARDDLEDGGASHYSATVEAIRKKIPNARIELLIPDFKGSLEALNVALSSKPTVINHNVETVERLTPQVRSKADYKRSLRVLDFAARAYPQVITKSGLMVGFGETKAEVLDTLKDIKSAGCSLVTIGQYLQPRAKKQIPVQRYWTPDEFEELKREALSMGFKGVAAGPFVRSSYFAEELLHSVI